MKTIYSILIFTLFTFQLCAQAPQKMAYQAVVRDNDNTLITSTPVGMRISILQGSASGSVVYAETQILTTNINGLVSLQIGNGTVVSGSFTAINWADGPYFVKTETDLTGGANYSVTGTTELLSVPYALYAESSSVDGFQHYIGEVFNDGVIFHLFKGNDGLEHGLIFSIAETFSPSYIWQSSTSLVGSDKTWDGSFNTQMMTNSPAKDYVTSLGNGWYIPSIDELTILFNNRFLVNKTAAEQGTNEIPLIIEAWSSTESSEFNAYSFLFNTGAVNVGPKSNSLEVIGIRSF